MKGEEPNHLNTPASILYHSVGLRHPIIPESLSKAKGRETKKLSLFLHFGVKKFIASKSWFLLFECSVLWSVKENQPQAIKKWRR